MDMVGGEKCVALRRASYSGASRKVSASRKICHRLVVNMLRAQSALLVMSRSVSVVSVGLQKVRGPTDGNGFVRERLRTWCDLYTSQDGR